MLGIVIAGNVAMVFVFWELVGICSYFLIGFYIERKSASNAANKAFCALIEGAQAGDKTPAEIFGRIVKALGG